MQEPWNSATKGAKSGDVLRGKIPAPEASSQKAWGEKLLRKGCIWHRLGLEAEGPGVSTSQNIFTAVHIQVWCLQCRKLTGL